MQEREIRPGNRLHQQTVTAVGGGRGRIAAGLPGSRRRGADRSERTRRTAAKGGANRLGWPARCEQNLIGVFMMGEDEVVCVLPLPRPG